MTNFVPTASQDISIQLSVLNTRFDYNVLTDVSTKQHVRVTMTSHEEITICAALYLDQIGSAMVV